MLYLPPTCPRSQHEQDAGAVVLDVEPVAHVAAVAVDRQRLALERVEDHQRDQLLGELVRAVVVRAVGDQRRQAVGLVSRRAPGGRRPPSRPRRASSARTGVVSVKRPVGAERAVDLVGGDVQEAEARRAPSAPSVAQVGAGGLEQLEGADDVGLDEGAAGRRSSGRRGSRRRSSPPTSGWCSRVAGGRPARGRRCRPGRRRSAGCAATSARLSRLPA